MPQVNLAQVQEAVAAAVGDRPAFIHRGKTLTHEELTTRSRQVANALIALGAPDATPRSALPGWETGQGHVAIISRNRPEWPEVIYGAYKARLASFNVNFRYTPAELAEVLADAAPFAVVYESWLGPALEQAQTALPEGCVLLQLHDLSGLPLLDGAQWYDDVVSGASTDKPDREWSPDDAYLLYTGGTTGRPKGVVWRQADIYAAAIKGARHAMCDDATRELELVVEAAVGSPPRIILPLPPFMHGAAQWILMSGIHGGDTIVVQDDVDHLDPADVWATVERHGVQVMVIVGDAFGRPLLEELRTGTHDASSMQLLITGGAVTSETLKRGLLEQIPHLIILDAGGSSESGSYISHMSTAAGVRTGAFVPGLGCAVVSDDRKRFIPPGDEEVGWLARAGALPQGYLHDAAKSEATFVEVDGVRVSIPGDRVQWLPDGMLALLGRESVTINTGGEKVFAEEVEQALMAHPCVADALAVGRSHERWGQEVVALVVVAPGSAVEADELTAHCRATLAGYKIPRAVLFVEAIRRSPAGKPDYSWGRDLAAASG